MGEDSNSFERRSVHDRGSYSFGQCFSAAVLLIAISFAFGYFLAGRDPGMRSVSGLGTAQRNVSAAMVVAAGNFSDHNVLVMILVGALLMLVILMPLGGELGKRQAVLAPAGDEAAAAAADDNR